MQTFIIGAAGFPCFLLIVGGIMALIVVMVLVMTAGLTTMVARILATRLLQFESEKTHSSSAADSPQRHGRALLASFAPPCTLPPRTEYNLIGSCATATPPLHMTLSLCHGVVCQLTFSWLEI